MLERKEFFEGKFYKVFYDNESNLNEIRREVIESDLEKRIKVLELGKK